MTRLILPLYLSLPHTTTLCLTPSPVSPPHFAPQDPQLRDLTAAAKMYAELAAAAGSAEPASPAASAAAAGSSGGGKTCSTLGGGGGGGGEDVLPATATADVHYSRGLVLQELASKTAVSSPEHRTYLEQVCGGG